MANATPISTVLIIIPKFLSILIGNKTRRVFSALVTHILTSFFVLFHQIQIMSNRSTTVPLRELRRLLRERLSESRDTIGFNLAALRAVARTTASKKESYLNYNSDQTKDIWAGMGLGSDLAAALENRKPAR